MIRAMHSHPDNIHSIAAMCQTLAVSRSGYYEHTHKALRPRRQQDQAIAAKLVEGFRLSRQTYGSPRLREVLKAQGIGVGRRRISRLMTTLGLAPKAKRRFVPRTTHSNHRGPIAANLLQQRGAPPARLNEIWVKDITYIPTGEGWLYLDATLDLCSRRVLGWHAAATMPAQLAVTSLRQAYRSRGVPLHGLPSGTAGQARVLLRDGCWQKDSRTGFISSPETAEYFLYILSLVVKSWPCPKPFSVMINGGALSRSCPNVEAPADLGLMTGV